MGRFRFGVLIVMALLPLTAIAQQATPQLTSTAPAQTATKSASYTELNIDLSVLENGNFHIEETQVVAFTGGPFTHGYRTIPLNFTDGITNAAVYEVIDGARVAYQKTDASLPHSFAATTSGTYESITWEFAETSNATRIFIVAYDMMGSLRSYFNAVPPVQQVRFLPIGSETTRETPVESSTFTTHLPKAAIKSSVVLSENGLRATELSKITSDYRTFTLHHDAFSSGESWNVFLQTSIVAPDAPVPTWQSTPEPTATASSHSVTPVASDGSGLPTYQRDMEEAVGSI